MWASSLMFLHQFQAYLPLILVMRAKLNHLFCSHCLTVWKSVRCLPNTICFEKRKERNHAIFFQSPFLSLQKTIVVLIHFFFSFLIQHKCSFLQLFFFLYLTVISRLIFGYFFPSHCQIVSHALA